jgi:hypothetical protein
MIDGQKIEKVQAQRYTSGRIARFLIQNRFYLRNRYFFTMDNRDSGANERL